MKKTNTGNYLLNSEVWFVIVAFGLALASVLHQS
jgi:hypothetical protein